MSQAIELKAKSRAGVGKGAARAVRREGRIPGVIYGDKKTAEPISVDYREMTLVWQRGRFLSTVVDLDVEGRKSKVIPRDVQVDPVRDFPIHVDFLRLSPGAKVRVKIPVKFVDQDKSPGLKRGGVLNVVRHEIEFMAPVDSIPDEVVASLDGMDIGHSLHISAIKLPPGLTPTITNRDFTVATVAGVKAEEEVKPVEATAEGEGAVPLEGAAPAEGEAAKTAEADKGGEKADKGGKK
jgi:large subunit ribosomal protein L25